MVRRETGERPGLPKLAKLANPVGADAIQAPKPVRRLVLSRVHRSPSCFTIHYHGPATAATTYHRKPQVSGQRRFLGFVFMYLPAVCKDQD